MAIKHIMPQTSSASALRRKAHCVICGPEAVSKERFPEHLDDFSLNFSARKAQRRNHFRIMECLQCGLVYSDDVFVDDHIAQLYHDAQFVNEAQLENMTRDYITGLRQVLSIKKGANLSLLEVGCANGFFLKAAKRMGLSRVVGVEPGADAVSHALPEVKSYIIND